jgi:hypothetical protein
MSDARALAATARCRELVAHPERVGLEPRPGLEPLDVVVQFNRLGAHTHSAFKVVVQMKLAMGGEDSTGNPVGPFRDVAGLVAQGKTEAEALEMFFNWMADENAVATFREVVKAHDSQQLDALAQAELAARRATDATVAAKAREVTSTWFEKKFDYVGRQLGIIPSKVQS